VTLAFAALPGLTDDEVVLRLTDVMVADGLADLRWALHDALLAGARRLVLDVSSVQSLSSSAVASFLAAHRTCRARGGGVVLTGANRRTEDLLHRTGLWRVLLAQQPPGEPEPPARRTRFSRRPPRSHRGA
jgi:anti-anti-sigma factor